MKNKVIYTHISEVCLEKSNPFFPILQTTIEKTNDVIILTATEAEARDIKRTLIKHTASSALPQIMSLKALITVTKTTHKKTKLEQFLNCRDYLKTISTHTQWFHEIKNKQGFIRHLNTAGALFNHYPFDSKIYVNQHPLGFGKSHQSLKLIQKIAEINSENTPLTEFETKRLAAYTTDKTLILIGLTYLTFHEKAGLMQLINQAQTCIAWVYDNATEDVLQNPHHFYTFIKTNWSLSELQQSRIETEDSYQQHTITKHPEKKDEVLDTLACILHTINSHGTTLDEIQILAHSPNTYTPLFRDYCALLNLPFNDGQHALIQFKAIEFIILAINAKSENYSRTSLLNWLKSPIWKTLSENLDLGFFDWLMKEFSLHGDIHSLSQAIERYIKTSTEPTIDVTFAQDQLRILTQINTLLDAIESANSIRNKLATLSDLINNLGLNIDDETRFITHSFLNTIRSLENRIKQHPFKTFYTELNDICTLTKLQIPRPSHHAVLRIDPIDHYIHNPRKFCFILGAQNIGTSDSSTRTIFFPNHLKKKLSFPNTQALTLQYLCHNLRAAKTVFISFTQDTPEIEGDISPTLSEALHFLNWKIESHTKHENIAILPKSKSLKQWNTNTTGPLFENSNTPNTFGELDLKSKTAWQSKVKQKSFSPTALESYQRCPYRYYLETVLGEKVCFKKDDDVQAHVWGSFLHHILQLFYEKFQETEKRVRPFNLKEANALLEKIAKMQLRHKEYAHFYWRVKALILLNIDEKKGLLSTLLDQESLDETDLYPRHFESRFKDVKLTLNNGSELALNGAIDMVMNVTDQPGIAILDYKTGKSIATAADITKFRHLQLPLYLMAAKQLYPNTPILGGIIFQINSADRCEKKVIMCTKDAKKEIFKLSRKRPAILDLEFEDNLIQHISKLHTLISNGYFTHAHHPNLSESEKLRKQTCSNCNYWNACQYPERFK